MVNSEGQFYTMEGIAAAVLMVITASLVMSTTSIYTSGDTHIQDMQLELLGNDALKVMDTPKAAGANSTLEELVRDWNNTEFNNEFNLSINEKGINERGFGNLYYTSNVFYINKTGVVRDKLFSYSRTYFGNPNAVRVTRWVFVGSNAPIDGIGQFSDFNRTRNQTVLLEVLIWRE
ncbi:MAG: hypothetical protein QHG99_04435 [Methanomicrobiales archaeon]|nr:hypothetical protein [Methanomicrobiales archaeon]